MIIPDNISSPAISLNDQYFDLKGLSAYSAFGVGTLRDYIRSDALPCFKVRGKILIKKSEFDAWVERYRINQAQDINSIIDGVMESLEV